MTSRRQFILAAGAAPAFAAAEDLSSQVRALRPSDVSAGERSVLDNLDTRARELLAAIPREPVMPSRDRAALLRSQLERSLGFRQLPWPPDLHARSTGVVRRQDYHIEKIVFHTFPGTQVPAHLYVPESLSGAAPAILFYTGHWWPDSKTHPDFQAFCINMARLGFVVFVFDAFGQGERGISQRDHRRTEALLVGISQQGLAEYETQCALAYLLGRPEVDPKRIGMTGASGGGYNTWMTSALDHRIAVAVPVVGTSEFAEQIHSSIEHDFYQASEHCHFVAGLLQYANNHELIALIAPRPLLIVSASVDRSFPIDGVRAVAGYARDLYRHANIPEKFGFYEDGSSGHGYQQKKREVAYAWFRRWLQNTADGGAYPEPATEVPAWDAPELRCFPPGGNQPAGPGMMAVVRALATTSRPALQLPRVRPPGLKRQPPFSPNLTGARAQRIEIPAAPGLQVPGFLLRPASSAAGVLLALDDRGKEELAGDEVVRAALDRNWVVCGVDPRGFGELATSKMGWVSATSLLMGDNFVSRQGWDLVYTMDYLAAASEFGASRLALYARGHNASLAAAFAVAQQAGPVRLRWYALRDGFISFRQFIERPESLRASYDLRGESNFRNYVYDREIPFHYFPFDALRQFDLPQVFAASAAESIIINPIDGDWRRMTEPDARKLLPPRTRVVSGDSPDAVRQAIAPWLEVPV
jgi:dienelactone hydrolase